jgi:hypothetical protein
MKIRIEFDADERTLTGGVLALEAAGKLINSLMKYPHNGPGLLRLEMEMDTIELIPYHHGR